MARIPVIAQGEQTANVTQTAHGMELLMNSHNIVMRRAVKNWDDNVAGGLLRMKYQEARPLIQSGDIIAFRRDSFVSSVIRAATRSDYSHVGIAWPVAGRVMLLEATLPLIRIFPLSKLLPFHWIALDKPLSLEAEEYALSRVGEEYSVMEAIRGYFGFTEINQKWQCAEYVKSVLNTSGWSFYGNDTPSVLVNEALRENGKLSLVTE